MDDNKILASAAQSASYNMAIQLTFRIATFILNGVMLRHVSRELLGVVNVRLMLLYTTVQFLTNEPFMRACLSKTRSDRRWPQIINLLWLCIPLGFIITVVVGSLWIWVLEQPDEASVQHYRFAVCCYCVAVVVEMLAQPLIITGQMLLFVRLKTIIDSIALAMRCIIMVSLVMNGWNILSFCIAQLIYSCLITIAYYVYFTRYNQSKNRSNGYPFHSLRDFFPKQLTDGPNINKELAGLTWSFSKQSFLKQLLTEGERYLMTVFGILSFPDQGIYDVINNLGSLAARFLFLPIEDGFYLFVTQTIHRGHRATELNGDSIRLVTRLFRTLLRSVMLIGLTFMVFGYAYSFLLLDIYGGSLLSSSTGPSLLRWYCLYVLIIAVNGVTEGFKNATMNQAQIDRYNNMMAYFTVMFLSCSLFLTYYLGSVGFILANCLNMLSRITHSVVYIRKFYVGYDMLPLDGLLVSPLELAAFAAALIVTVSSEVFFCCSLGWVYRLLHIAVGGLCLGVVALVVWYKERDLVAFVKEQYRNRNDSRKIVSEKVE